MWIPGLHPAADGSATLIGLVAVAGAVFMGSVLYIIGRGITLWIMN